MEMSETPIVTIGLGIVASMALAIFIAGDYRISARHARFMYHSISYGAVGYIQDHEDAQTESALLQRMYNSLFHERTNLPKEVMEDIKVMKKDFFFSSKESLKFGVSDKVMKKPDKKFEFFTGDELENIKNELSDLVE